MVRNRNVLFLKVSILKILICFTYGFLKTDTTTTFGTISKYYGCSTVPGSCPSNTATDQFECCYSNNCNTVTLSGSLTCNSGYNGDISKAYGCAACAVSDLVDFTFKINKEKAILTCFFFIKTVSFENNNAYACTSSCVQGKYPLIGRPETVTTKCCSNSDNCNVIIAPTSRACCLSGSLYFKLLSILVLSFAAF